MLKVEPEVSVVICHHTGDLLFPMLDSLFKSRNVNFEVIVLTSNEGLAMKGIKGCIVMHSLAMPAEKRNIGVRLSKGRYIAFFDDDVVIDPLCLYHLKNGLGLYVGMTYGKLWNMEHRNRFDEAGGYLTWTGFIWSRAGQNDLDEGQYDKDEFVLAGKSASCMVKKEVFNKAGGFDESFGILGEETDLSWRIWLKGYTIMYTPKATGYHAFNTKFKPKEKHYTNSRVFFNGSRNYITMLIKNLGKEHLWIVPIHMTIWFSVACVMLLTLKVSQGLHIMKGLWYVVVNIRSILTKRQKVQETRKVNESDLWKKVYRKTPGRYWRTRFLRYVTLGLHG